MSVPPPVIEEEEYDYVAHRPPHKGTTVLEATGHLIKGCLGAGILGIPEGYVLCGVWTAVVCTFIFGVYITYCVNILVTSAQELYVRLKIPQMSYPDLAQKSLENGPWPSMKKCGKAFRYLVDIIICLDLFGSCCVYQIMMAKTLCQLVTRSEEDILTDTQIRIYICIVYFPVILLCMIRSLKFLAPFTLVADSFIVMCVIATVVYSLKVAPPISEATVFTDYMKFFEFCGMIVFSMEGVGVALPIENTMKNPRKYKIVLVAGMSVVVGFVFITGFFGSWGYGQKVQNPIILNFPRNIVPTILKALVGLMIYVTFALNFWAPFNLLWYYLQKKYDPKKHYIWERIYRTIIITVITAFSLAFPRVGPLIGLIGSFCLSNMGFIFPAIIETAIIHTHGYGVLKWRLIKNILIIIIGIILCISGTYSNGKSLFRL